MEFAPDGRRVGSKSCDSLTLVDKPLALRGEGPEAL
jgi:hypothetical protein